MKSITKTKLSILIVWLLSCFFITCKESSFNVLDKKIEGVYFDKDRMNRADSLNYSFATKPSTLLQDTLWVAVAAAGEVSTSDRQIPFIIDFEKTTAREGVDFLFLSKIIPKGESRTRIPILINRTARMKSEELRIFLTIGTNQDFSNEIAKTRVSSTQNLGVEVIFSPGLLIKISDILKKPEGWDNFGSQFQRYFGDYSDVKWKFILEVTGRTEWGYMAQYGPGAPTDKEMRAYRGLLIAALEIYERENGFLIDEFGKRVTFLK